MPDENVVYKVRVGNQEYGIGDRGNAELLAELLGGEIFTTGRGEMLAHARQAVSDYGDKMFERSKMSEFEILLRQAEAGQEIASQSFSAGYVATWYETPEFQFQVRYDSQTGEPTSVQIVGTEQVFFPS